HSLLLTRRGGQFLSRITPAGIGTELRTTTFALIASLQLLLTFLLWAPLGPVIHEFHGSLRAATPVFYALGWLLLMKSMSDAGLGIQMGYLGWFAVFRNRKPRYKPFEAKGSLKVTRHPMYFAYTLLLWTGPDWTPDHLIVAGCWTLYCLLAPLHKESRYRKRYGETFKAYQKQVPYLFPRMFTLRSSKSS
ncbi:MAG: methyltransferase family protein, partial [Kiritimatiellia bacterium]